MLAWPQMLRRLRRQLEKERERVGGLQRELEREKSERKGVEVEVERLMREGEVMTWLAEKRAVDCSRVDAQGRTALHLAACEGREGVVRWLVEEAGAE
eukprot:1355904-Rhodomonas_salina.1